MSWSFILDILHSTSKILTVLNLNRKCLFKRNHWDLKRSIGFQDGGTESHCVHQTQLPTFVMLHMGSLKMKLEIIGDGYSN